MEFQSEGEIVARTAIPVTLDVSEQGAQPDVARGRRLTLVIAKKGIRVTTSGIVQADANVGDVVQVQVATTGRVLKAAVKSIDEAEVIETP
jgi:flagella basal body P-ring formation protein FlgA